MAVDPSEAAKVRTMLDHIDAHLATARAAYLGALDDALLFVISEATTPTRRGQLAPGAAYIAQPGDTVSHRLDADGHLMCWPAGAPATNLQRLNRTDLAAAADRLGLHLPELHNGRPS